MKYDQYKKLEEKINNENFNHKYKTINIIKHVMIWYLESFLTSIVMKLKLLLMLLR
jgi:hypothetical protein